MHGMDSVTIIALAGLLTTAAAPLLHGWLAKRWQEAMRLRDLRTQLYAEACLFAQYHQSVIGHYTDPVDRSGPRLAKPPPADGITARMRLLAEDKVLVAWQRLLTAEDAIGFTLDQDPSLGAGRLLDWNDPEVVTLNEAAENFYSVASRAARGVKGSKMKAIEP